MYCVDQPEERLQHEDARDLDITQKSAWFLLHRVRHEHTAGGDV